MQREPGVRGGQSTCADLQEHGLTSIAVQERGRDRQRQPQTVEGDQQAERSQGGHRGGREQDLSERAITAIAQP